ncbi:MAG: hypothetical protein OXQ29_18070 [Rhodospirillaceae bacterium]|nr:hypothetical protein [Rhodospirillaceae bacterium]
MPSRDILFTIKAQDDSAQALNRVEGNLEDVAMAAKGVDESLDDVAKEFDDVADSAKAADRALDRTGKELADVDDAAGKSADSVGGAGISLGKIAGIAGGLAAAGSLVDMAGNFAEGAIQAERLASALDSDVSTASSLSNALEAAGGSGEIFIPVGEKLTQVIADAKLGSEGAKDGIAALGLSVEELEAQSGEARLRTLIDAISDTGKTTEEVGQIMTAFGGGQVAELQAAMKSLEVEGFDALVAKGGELGHVMSDEDVDAAQDLQAAMGDLRKAFDGVVAQVLPDLVTGLQQIADVAPDVIDLVKGIAGGSAQFVEGVVGLIDTISLGGTTISETTRHSQDFWQRGTRWADELGVAYSDLFALFREFVGPNGLDIDAAQQFYQEFNDITGLTFQDLDEQVRAHGGTYRDTAAAILENFRSTSEEAAAAWEVAYGSIAGFAELSASEQISIMESIRIVAESESHLTAAAWEAAYARIYQASNPSGAFSEGQGVPVDTQGSTPAAQRAREQALRETQQRNYSLPYTETYEGPRFIPRPTTPATPSFVPPPINPYGTERPVAQVVINNKVVGEAYNDDADGRSSGHPTGGAR